MNFNDWSENANDQLNVHQKYHFLTFLPISGIVVELLQLNDVFELIVHLPITMVNAL